MEEETKVIFRKWKNNGEIIAIFPEYPGDSTPGSCCSWEFVGEHGSCDPDHVIRKTNLANILEYGTTKYYLERRYGYKLKVYRRLLPYMRVNNQKEREKDGF